MHTIGPVERKGRRIYNMDRMNQKESCPSKDSIKKRFIKHEDDTNS